MFEFVVTAYGLVHQKRQLPGFTQSHSMKKKMTKKKLTTPVDTWNLSGHLCAK
jgi:hypothetical protein